MTDKIKTTKEENTDNDYSLGEFDHLCFDCYLSDCKENSKKCLINIAKKDGIKSALSLIK